MTMYLGHFGLREAPFRITPHTEFFFSGANRGATLEALLYAITAGEGMVKVTGEVGSGKTMLCRVLMERLPSTVETIYLAVPSLTRDRCWRRSPPTSRSRRRAPARRSSCAHCRNG
jgi:MSHA biogenesis protein MshM